MSQKNIQPFDLCSEPDWSTLFGQSYKIMLLNDQSLLEVGLEGTDITTPISVENIQTNLRKAFLGLVERRITDLKEGKKAVTPEGEISSRNLNAGEKVQPAIDILDQKISELGLRVYLVTNIIRRTRVEYIRPLLLLTEADFRECMQGIMSDESFESLKAVLAKHGLRFSEE